MSTVILPKSSLASSLERNTGRYVQTIAENYYPSSFRQLLARKISCRNETFRVETCYRCRWFLGLVFPFTKFKLPRPPFTRFSIVAFERHTSCSVECRQWQRPRDTILPEKRLPLENKQTTSPFPPRGLCACKRATETELAGPFVSHKALSALGRRAFLQFIRLYAYVSG